MPAIRRKISLSKEPAAVLAARYAMSEDTVRRWRGHDSFGHRSLTAHQFQTSLTRVQEIVVVELRRMLLLPLDNLLAITREFLNPHVSRPGLDSCLLRDGVGNLYALKPKELATARKGFKAYQPGFLHIDVKYLPQMPDETSRWYLFVAINRAMRWVFVRIMSSNKAANARRDLRALARACPIKISKILTDNGKEFADRFFSSRAREASGDHEFDQLCAELSTSRTV